jgi:serine protease Do
MLRTTTAPSAAPKTAARWQKITGRFMRLSVAIAVCLAVFPRCISAQTLAALNSAGGPAASETASSIIQRVQPSLIQIRGHFGTNTAKAFHGTGFAVAPDGIFATNYHVVAEHILHPEKYRLEYKTADLKSGALAVIAIDVKHDLAIVRAEGYAPEPLTLSTVSTAKGEKAYSVGFPLDVGLTITEGISNSEVSESFNPRIHYSGAINGGMSGGPAFNAAGEVIGVNVSAYRFQQLVSFLVPVAHVRQLRDDAKAQTRTNRVLKDNIQTQLTEHSKALLTSLEGTIATQNSGGYDLPSKIASFVDCSANGQTTPKDPVQLASVSCAAKAGLYMQRGFYSGDIRYSHNILTTETLDSWRFARRLSLSSVSHGAYGSSEHVGPFACEDQILALKGFDAAVLICTRGYRKLENLYDFAVRIVSLNGKATGFASQLDMFGMEFATGMKFIRRYLESMEFKS